MLSYHGMANPQGMDLEDVEVILEYVDTRQGMVLQLGANISPP
jgi:hypothetical protein